MHLSLVVVENRPSLRCLREAQCALSQLGPRPTSASSGTFKSATPAIRRGISVRTQSDSKVPLLAEVGLGPDRKSTRLNSSHSQISYAVFCLKKKKKT